MRERESVGVCVYMCVYTHVCACLSVSAVIVCFVLVENAANDYKALWTVVRERALWTEVVMIIVLLFLLSLVL